MLIFGLKYEIQGILVLKKQIIENTTKLNEQILAYLYLLSIRYNMQLTFKNIGSGLTQLQYTGIKTKTLNMNANILPENKFFKILINVYY